jgi:LPXTG-site transpeptidase (sortase) family protein
MVKSKKTTKLHKNRLFFSLGIIMIISSLSLGGLDFLKNWFDGQGKHVNALALVSNEPVVTPDPTISGVPTRIKIASLNIDLEIVPGVYESDKKSWSLSLNKAHWGTITNPSNNKTGLTFIYAHNRKGIFNSLPKVQPGDKAVVTTDNNHTFTYSFTASTVTNPEDTSIFGYTGKPILVLQTCTGTWYENRQLFVFDFVDAQ